MADQLIDRCLFYEIICAAIETAFVADQVKLSKRLTKWGAMFMDTVVKGLYVCGTWGNPLSTQHVMLITECHNSHKHSLLTADTIDKNTPREV